MTERQEAEKIVLQLREAAKTDMNIATSMRTEAPASSMFWFKMAELMETAAKTLESRLPVEEELEGGGTTWWYVCSECRGAVDTSDMYCKHCGRKFIKDKKLDL